VTEHFLALPCTVQNNPFVSNQMDVLSTSHPGARESTHSRNKVAPKAAPDARQTDQPDLTGTWQIRSRRRPLAWRVDWG